MGLLMGPRDTVAAAVAWLPYADQHWREYPGQTHVGYFGTGTVAIQSVEAVAEHALVCATLGTQAVLHAADAPAAHDVRPDHLVERALQGLRFLTETHSTGA